MVFFGIISLNPDFESVTLYKTRRIEPDVFTFKEMQFTGNRVQPLTDNNEGISAVDRHTVIRCHRLEFCLDCYASALQAILSTFA